MAKHEAHWYTGLFTRACAAMMTLVACKAGWGESIVMALVWVSGVGPCMLTSLQLQSRKLTMKQSILRAWWTWQYVP